MHAPEVTAEMRARAEELDAVSDEIDKVNILKGKAAAAASDAGPRWDDASTFDAEKNKAEFRRYEEACDRVKNFYAEQHKKQTYAWNVQRRAEIKGKEFARMGIWEAMEMLDKLVDESDPDTSVGQIEHLLQTAEAIRKDGKPDWMILVGAIHDLGKLLCFFGADGQWDVVGDIFPIGCKFSDKIVYPETFKENPDYYDERYNTTYGVYQPNCGIENLMMTFSHDCYLADICAAQSSLPKEAIWQIRYHSFYPWHREGAYTEFMKPGDEAILHAVRAFNPYDLYSKSDAPPDKEALKPFYQSLIRKYFPDEVVW